MRRQRLHDPGAAAAALAQQGVRAVRLLYTDLHGVARGKDIPIPHFADMCEEGVAFCAAVMGTDLRTRRSSAARRDTSTSRSGPTSRRSRQVPWQPEVAWCLGEAWTLDGSEHWPVCPRALLKRVIDSYAERGLTPIVARSSSSSSLERDPSHRAACAVTSTSSPASTRSAPSPIRARSCCGCCSGATSSGCRRSPRTTSS